MPVGISAVVRLVAALSICLTIDLGLNGGLLRSGWKSEIYERSGHPCRSDFEVFGKTIGIRTKRLETLIEEFLSIPTLAKDLISRSFLDEKMRRSYLRIINERLTRFHRLSD